MRIIGRRVGRHRTWAARRSTDRQAAAGWNELGIPNDQRRQPTCRELAEGECSGQYEERLDDVPGSPGYPRTKPEAVRALALDQEQAQVVLAALEDAAVLRREAIGNCPDCRSAEERVCTDHQGSWETADEYDALRWHLDSPYRDSQAHQEAEAEAARELADDPGPGEPGFGEDRSVRTEQAKAAALKPEQIGHGGELEPGE